METNDLMNLTGMIGNNIKRLIWDNDKKIWIITYKNGLPIDEVNTDVLIDFLNNA